MSVEELSKYNSGAAGNNVAANTVVATIATPGKGRWKVWGTVRHTLVDGCKLLVGSTTLMTITNAANGSESFGPIIVDILNNTDNIVIQLATATGAADTASANLYAQRAYTL